MKKRLVKKILLILVVAIEIFAMNFSFVLAAGIKLPSVGSIMSQIESRYHMNTGGLQNLGETMNVSQYKMDAPSMSVFFTPTDPKPGEKITAQALPMYFKSPKEKMYFTWYLKHKNGNKNWDKNGSVGIEDYKIEAMRIVANGGWEPDLDANGDGVNESANVAEWYKKQPKDGDNDEYEAIIGGESRGNISEGYCYLKEPTNGIFYELGESLSAGTVVTCAAGTTAYCGNDENGADPTNDGLGAFTGFSGTEKCLKVAGSPTCGLSGGDAVCSTGTAVCAKLSGSYLQTASDADALCSSSSFSAPTCSGTSTTPSKCDESDHLFAWKDDTGDNSFDKDEEENWGTDPNDPDTDDDGVKDEADASGLGQDKFSWIYEPGDEVGVVVEGISMNATKHNGSEYMIMWGFSKNKCVPDDDGSYQETVKGYNVNFDVTGTNPNSCLMDNLIDPKQGGQNGPMEVTLMTTPDNPVNDQSGDNFGDIVSVQAMVGNSTQNEAQLFYKWSVKYSDDGTVNPSEWKSVSDADLKKAGIKISQGNDLSALNLSMNFGSSLFKNGVGYFKIRAEIREATDTSASRRGAGEVIVKVTSSEERIKAYKTTVDTNLKLGFGSMICNKPEEKAVCYVSKNDIIGLAINPDVDGKADLKNFNWSIDGKTLTCDPTYSSKCISGKQNENNFFPISKKPGEKYVVELSANNISTGQTVNYTRTFVVAEPYIKIVPGNYDPKSSVPCSLATNFACPKTLGRYKDLDGNIYKNESESIVEALANNFPTKLRAEIHPSWMEGDCEGEWLIDGELVVDGTVNENGIGENGPYEVLNFDTGSKNPGEVFNISFNAVCNKDDNYRKALRDIWGIPESSSVEQAMSGKLQVEVSDVVGAEGKDANFLATIYSNASGQMIFLLRIILTVFLIVFVSGAVFSLAPQRKE